MVFKNLFVFHSEINAVIVHRSIMLLIRGLSFFLTDVGSMCPDTIFVSKAIDVFPNVRTMSLQCCFFVYNSCDTCYELLLFRLLNVTDIIYKSWRFFLFLSLYMRALMSKKQILVFTYRWFQCWNRRSNII